MKRRIKTTVISMIILTLAEISMILSVQANKIDNFDSSKQIIIVDQSGEGNYKTIQEAVNNAQPGSTIYVKKGNYKEVIMIKKEIRLVGEEKYSTLINPISEKNKYAICLGAQKIRIEIRNEVVFTP